MPTLSPSAWADIRRDYEHTERPVHEICAEHGISAGTLRDRMRRWNWARRRPPIPPEGPPPLPAPVRVRAAVVAQAAPETPGLDPPPGVAHAATDAASDPPAETALACADGGVADADPGAPIEPAAIAHRLQAAAARVLPAIEATVARLAAHPAHPREMERAGRALATLTRTLRELNALLSRYPAPETPEDGPADSEAFILELARRMDHFAATYVSEPSPQADPAQEREAGGSGVDALS